MAARAAQRGIEFAFLGIGQPHDLAADAREIEIAIQRDQHARTILGPLIVDDPCEVADARAFALHLLVLGQFAARPQRFAVDQHRPCRALAVIGPQIVALAILLAVAQQREIAAIGRQLDLARARPVEIGRREDAFETQFHRRGLRALRGGLGGKRRSEAGAQRQRGGQFQRPHHLSGQCRQGCIGCGSSQRPWAKASARRANTPNFSLSASIEIRLRPWGDSGHDPGRPIPVYRPRGVKHRRPVAVSFTPPTKKGGLPNGRPPSIFSRRETVGAYALGALSRRSAMRARLPVRPRR